MRSTRRTRFETPPATPAEVTHRRVLAIALPIMASNVSEPLIGLVDTAVIGQLPDPHYIGAIAVGALIFSFVYWGFGFLRMGTGGFTAQAVGAGDSDEVRAVLTRALLIAGSIGVVLIAISPLLADFAFAMIDGSPEVEGEARHYFIIRIWSAPFALANYALLGWFIGRGETRVAFALQLLLNITNMILDAVFVLGFGMATAGVGLGTLIAEVVAALAGLFIVFRLLRGTGSWDWPRVFDPARIKRTFVVNGDIMVRTFSIAAAFWWFTAQGAKAGDVIIAANAVLMQFFSLASFMIDGFAHSVEVLAGQAVGARNRSRFDRAVRLSSVWALVSAAVISALILLAGPWLIDLLSVNPDVRSTARTYLIWVAIAPIIAAACFQLDGIFIGATQTRDMRNMMFVSLAVFLVACRLLVPPYGNHGLWWSMLLFLAARGVTLGVRLPALRRQAFPTN